MKTRELSLTEKLRSIRDVISNDILGSDIKISIFVGSAITYRYDSCCVPFPSDWIVHGEKDITRITNAIKNIPNLLYFLKTNEADAIKELKEDSILLLYWLLVELKGPRIKTIPKTEFENILSKTPQETPINQSPTHIFCIESPDSKQELVFQQYANEFSTSFGFHGTKLFYLHNILHMGLQQHLSKNALFGEGLYFSSELNVSLPYSRNGIGWTNSQISNVMSCVALCEFVEHPVFSKRCHSKENNKRSELPEKYIIVSNNDCVRLRYLIVYASKSNVESVFSGITQRWAKWFNFGTLSIVYLLILVFVGMIDSPYLNYLKKSLMQKVQGSLNYLLQKESN